MIRTMRWISVPCCVLMLLLAIAPAFAQDEDEVPEHMWELRDKYTFDGPVADLGYAVDYGDWRILTPTLGEIFSNIGCQIVLDDGTVVTPRGCGKALTTRSRAENAIGPGIVYLTQCPAKDGLKVTHKMASYQNRSGVTVHLEVENVGDTPIVIKSLQPMVAEPGEIKQLRMESDGSGGPYVFTNSSENVAILLGTIPLGGVETQLSFSEAGGAITGGASSTADALTLAPGERLETDPFMIVFVYGDPAKAREFFGYAFADATGQASTAVETAPFADAGAATPEDSGAEAPKKRSRRFFGR